ncbi:unnamed protein product [Mytilus edulis]|uniref:Fibronectin type-III domain-containing protein n=1 Tax=Mytilus edulis TaxID=6550 RepID=A0A8S3VQY3_MYTED|nr:unnamed protein product [Mytilus edulis]
MEEKEIPALGRPFDLGMLYDCRTNNLITDRRVWNEQSIKQHTTSQSQPQCDFDFTAEDTISAKTSFLDINAELKLSLLLGWIKVDGSAKYLENHRTFTRQSRVSFKYRCRTHFKELRINEIISEQQGDRRVLHLGNATHVVTGILYGIDAIFIFDRNTTDNEDTLQIHNKLEAMIKFLPKVSATSKTNEHKNKLLDNVKFTYHGDVPLDLEPSSFEEAIKAFKTLPSKVGQKAENCVPMHIWLCPLDKLTSKKVTLNAPLHVTLINQIQDNLEKIQVLKMKCNDLTARPTCQYDESYRQKVDEMQAIVKQSEQKLKSDLQEDDSCSAGQSKQFLRSKISSIRKTVKNDLDMFVSKFTETENNNIELSIPLRPGKPSVIRRQDGTMEVTWLVPPNVPHDYFYEVSYRPWFDGNWKILPYLVKNPYVRFSNYVLFIETNYVFRVRCLCGSVFGQYSETSESFFAGKCNIL